MASNSFVIDPQLLEQAKAYAKAAAEENREYSRRLGNLIDELYTAIDGIDNALAEGIQNNQITQQRGNFTNREKQFEKNSQRAEKLCDMIQMCIDQGDNLENGLMEKTSSLLDIVQDIRIFSHTVGASNQEGQVLGATKAVAVSGAALAGTFGLLQGNLFTNLKDILQRFVNLTPKIISENIIGSKTDVPAQKLPTPERINLDTLDLTTSILDIPDEKLPNVGANRIQFKDKGGQINCLWLARQKMCKIIGDDTLFSDQKLGIKAANWEKYEESGINGFSVDYRTVASKTKMEDIVQTLKSDQPCSAMFYLNGHTFTVDRIQDGKVYWTDNFTPVGEKPYYKSGICTNFDGDVYRSSYTGMATSASLEEFAKWYDNFAGALKSYVILKKE